MIEPDPDSVVFEVRLPRSTIEAAILATIERPRDRKTSRVAFAKWILGVRRRRSKMFPEIRLGEPTWDMVLDLYIADNEKRQVDVSGLCLASGVAPTTALRYVGLLVTGGHIVKIDDRDDGRRSVLRMSATLHDTIDAWLDHSEAGLALAGWTPASNAHPADGRASAP